MKNILLYSFLALAMLSIKTVQSQNKAIKKIKTQVEVPDSIIQDVKNRLGEFEQISWNKLKSGILLGKVKSENFTHKIRYGADNKFVKYFKQIEKKDVPKEILKTYYNEDLKQWEIENFEKVEFFSGNVYYQFNLYQNPNKDNTLTRYKEVWFNSDAKRIEDPTEIEEKNLIKAN
jgi:hypothetical protein